MTRPCPSNPQPVVGEEEDEVKQSLFVALVLLFCALPCQGAGYRIEILQVGNVDATLALERPKVKPHIAAMRSALAPVLGVDPAAVGIKATTNEGMGFVGREEGVCAWAVALVQRG